MADLPDKPPATWDQMYQLILDPSVGNRFVNEVNNFSIKKGYSTNSDIFMKVNIESVEKVYGVVINEIEIPTPGKENEWKLVKVGMTGKPTKKGTNNRMEQLMSGIGAESSVLFKLPKGFYDTTSNIFQVEKRVRNHLGLSVSKELIKKMNLPCSTEWTLTTQTDINELLGKMKEKKDAREWCTTQILKELPKGDWKYWKMELPDGLVLDKKRNEIVLSSPGQLPDWLNKELEKFGTEKETRPRRSTESGVRDETATTPYAPTPGQKKNTKTETNVTAGEGANNCPPSPKEDVTEASPKTTGGETALPEGTYTDSGHEGFGKKTTSSSSEGARTESDPDVTSKMPTPSTPKGISRESGSKVPRKKLSLSTLEGSSQSTLEGSSPEQASKGTRKNTTPSTPAECSAESNSSGGSKGGVPEVGTPPVFGTINALEWEWEEFVRTAPFTLGMKAPIFRFNFDRLATKPKQVEKNEK